MRQCDDSGFRDGSLHGLDLLVGDTGKPGQEVLHRRAVFEILEKSPHRHPRGFEQPETVHLPGLPFDRRTLSPIRHRLKVTSTLAALEAFAGSLGGRAAVGGCKGAIEFAHGPVVGDRDLAVCAPKVPIVRTLARPTIVPIADNFNAKPANSTAQARLGERSGEMDEAARKLTNNSPRRKVTA